MSVRSFATLAAAWSLAAAAAAVHAQDYPTQPVALTVNFPPAGVTDLVARSLGTAMAPLLKQPVIVENRAGAGGAIGVTAVANAPRDGYHLGFLSIAALTALPQMRSVPYHIDSLAYICRAFEAPVFLLVAPGSRFHDTKSVVAYAKANPGRLNYATVGPGSLPHLAALDFAAKAGITITHIPYQGEAPAVTDLLGGHVDLYFGTSAVASTHRLRRLGVAAESRAADAKDVPTLAELGYPVSWSVVGGMIAPAGIDAKVRQTLEQACSEAVKTPAYRSALAQLQLVSAYANGADFKSQVLREAGMDRVILKSAGLLQASGN
ncbi:MAG: tripartite tricarboxylate transporter substrate binding protein [Pseudomonadota bacterium]